MLIAGRPTPIAAPDSHGILTALVDVLLDDCYGLDRLAGANVNRVLDIGGNVGFFALAARNAFPQATIHVYEPSPSVIPFLEHNVGGHDVQVFPEAVGASDGFVAVDEHPHCVLTSVHVVESSSIRQVGLQTAIDRLGGCDLAKIDCEGAEWDLFRNRGAWPSIKRVSMEYHLHHSGRQLSDVVDALEGFGFEIERLEPGSAEWGLVWAKRQGSGSAG